MIMCELTLAVSHPPYTGEEQVVQEEPQGEEFDLI
jgi:ribosomal protein L31